MIAGCPTCAARYRIDTAKLRPEGARLRCSRCETVFRVQAPPDTPTAPAARAPSTTPSVQDQASVAAPEASGGATSSADAEKLVLIAHPDQEAGKQLADAVSSWGLSALLVHDGVEAIMNIQRALPKVVVLDAALPKMFGFQVCELMKRNEQLRPIPVVLIGAIHDRDRYRRPPEDLYGADAYAERHELPSALAEHLVRFGLAPSGGATASEPAPPAPAAAPPSAGPPPTQATPAAPVAEPRPAAPVPAPRADPAPAASTPAAPAPSATSETAENPENEKGLRLARIIVSDVILYNPEKFEAAVRDGNVVEALASELEEGFALFAQRVDTNICEPREFLERELVRVARSRGMSG